MTTALVTQYAGRFSSPDFIERAKDQRLTFEVQYEGATVRPASGTLTLRNEANTAIVNTAAISVSADGVAYYDLSAALVPATYAPSQRWLEDWALTFDDGQVHTFRRPAHLCVRRLYSVLVQSDLTGRHHDLQTIVPRAKSSLQPYMDGAFDEAIDRLLEDGRYPQQVMTPDRLRRFCRAYALHLAFLDAMNEAPGEGKYGGLANFYLGQAEDAWTKLRFTIDHDEDNGPPGEDEEGQSESPVVYLGGAPSTRDGYQR